MSPKIDWRLRLANEHKQTSHTSSSNWLSRIHNTMLEDGVGFVPFSKQRRNEEKGRRLVKTVGHPLEQINLNRRHRLQSPSLRLHRGQHKCLLSF